MFYKLRSILFEYDQSKTLAVWGEKLLQASKKELRKYNIEQIIGILEEIDPTMNKQDPIYSIKYTKL